MDLSDFHMVLMAEYGRVELVQQIFQRSIFLENSNCYF